VSIGVAAAASALGAAHLLAYYAGRRALAASLKALPILLLAATVWAMPGAAGSSYARLVFVGLGLSAMGDLSLVFPKGFLAGLSAFLAAHLCYIGAFAGSATTSPIGLLAAGVVAAVAAAMLARLWSHLDRVRWPVAGYVLVLSSLASVALVRALAPAAPPGAVAAALGATAFFVSDGVLAFDRFVRRFRGAHALVMVTYYAAQMLIATSAL
jgi:uncharacterized membrane protein YhhN